VFFQPEADVVFFLAVEGEWQSLLWRPRLESVTNPTSFLLFLYLDKLWSWLWCLPHFWSAVNAFKLVSAVPFIVGALERLPRHVNNAWVHGLWARLLQPLQSIPYISTHKAWFWWYPRGRSSRLGLLCDSSVWIFCDSSREADLLVLDTHHAWFSVLMGASRTQRRIESVTSCTPTSISRTCKIDRLVFDKHWQTPNTYSSPIESVRQMPWEERDEWQAIYTLYYQRQLSMELICQHKLKC